MASFLPVLLGTETKKDAKCSRFVPVRWTGGMGGGGGWGTDNYLGVAGMDTAGVEDEIKKISGSLIVNRHKLLVKASFYHFLQVPNSP